MSAPCEQKSAIDQISHTLMRMEQTQDKLVALLEKVAAQDARLDHLEEHGERTYQEMDQLFNRVRDTEMVIASTGPNFRQTFETTMKQFGEQVDDLIRFIEILKSRPAIFVYTLILFMIASGTFLDFMYHFDMLKQIIQFVRG